MSSFPPPGDYEGIELFGAYNSSVSGQLIPGTGTFIGDILDENTGRLFGLGGVVVSAPNPYLPFLTSLDYGGDGINTLCAITIYTYGATEELSPSISVLVDGNPPENIPNLVTSAFDAFGWAYTAYYHLTPGVHTFSVVNSLPGNQMTLSMEFLDIIPPSNIEEDEINMPSLTTRYLKNFAAIDFRQSIANNSFYLFLGNETPWSNNDTTISNVTQSVTDFKSCWANIYSAKKITSNDVSLVIRRINWTINSNYVEYSDNDPTLFQKNFYVLNSNNEVFKCISNNNGAIVSDEPLGIGSLANNYIQTTSDGYQWKYMFNVDTNDKFLNSDWIPVSYNPTQGTNQYVIASSAIPGSIDRIKVLDGGSGYTDNSQSIIILSIVGDGSGAVAYANVVGGQVKNIEMINRGKNYNFANVVAVPSGQNTFSAVPILSPTGGHGSRADLELFANTIMISSSVSGSENGYFTTNNKFRTVGVLLNPTNYGTNDISTNNEVKMSTTVFVTSGVGSFQKNELVYQGIADPYYNPYYPFYPFSGQVIDFDPITNKLTLNNIFGTPTIGNILNGANSESQRVITSILNPDINPYSGQIVYISNNTPIQRSDIQTENFKIIIKF